MDADRKRELIRKEIEHLKDGGDKFPANAIAELISEIEKSKKDTTLKVQSIIIPDQKVAEGVLIKSVSMIWARIVEVLHRDWPRAYEIPPRVWEEIVAGAFSKAKYDEVILTPRSGDGGRDVIATRHGFGSIRILGEVKAYAPGHLVRQEQVRAVLHVLANDHKASKAIITTTSDFAPKMESDPTIEPYLPHRLELMNGEKLREWLTSLSKQP
jgi:restriction system protein